MKPASLTEGANQLGQSQTTLKIIALLFSTLFATSNSAGALAAEFTDARITELAAKTEPWIVRLRVTGTFEGSDAPLRVGTGFFISTPGALRIITAKHVVGRNQEFERVPMSGSPEVVKRTIKLELSPSFSKPTQALTLQRIVEHDLDVAQVPTELPSDCSAPTVSARALAPGETLLVLPGRGERTLAQVAPTRDGHYIRLNKEFPDGASGSPVLDVTGRVVAVVVARSRPLGVAGPRREQPYSSAIPVSEFIRSLPEGASEAPNPRISVSLDPIDKPSRYLPDGRPVFSTTATIRNRSPGCGPIDVAQVIELEICPTVTRRPGRPGVFADIQKAGVTGDFIYAGTRGPYLHLKGRLEREMKVHLEIALVQTDAGIKFRAVEGNPLIQVVDPATPIQCSQQGSP